MSWPCGLFNTTFAGDPEYGLRVTSGSVIPLNIEQTQCPCAGNIKKKQEWTFSEVNMWVACNRARFPATWPRVFCELKITKIVILIHQIILEKFGYKEFFMLVMIGYIFMFRIAGFTLSYARYGKLRNGYDVMQIHARIWKGLGL